MAGKRVRERSGSHRVAPRRSRAGRRTALVAALTAAIVAVGFGYFKLGATDPGGAESASDCVANVTLAAAPDIAETVQDRLREVGCTRVKVTSSAPSTVLGQVDSGQRQPDLWIPDSSLWPEQTDSAVRTLVPSLATTPVVLVSEEDEPPASWRAALASDDFVLGDPGTSTPAVTALYGGARSSKSRLFSLALAAPDPKPARTNQDATDQEDRLKRVAKSGGSTVVTERAWLNQAPDLTASVPKPGTITLDYPLVLTASKNRRAPIKKTVDAVVATLTSDSSTRALSKQNFRVSDVQAPDNGVGKVTNLSSDAEAFSALLKRWDSLMLPIRGIAVIDVSGSMNFDAGRSTRVELIVSGAQRILPLFPDRVSFGLWVFSQADDGALGADYRQTLPVRRMDAEVDGSTQRAQIAKQLGRLQSFVGGGTSLYDTTLAAYEKAVRDYDPRAHNNVFLFTDGTNEDPDSISRSQLISGLRELVNPKRPVKIISFGMSSDADADTLEEISKVTNGESFIARDPKDIEKVLRQVMMASS